MDSLLKELLAEAKKPSVYDRARTLLKPMLAKGTFNMADMQAVMKRKLGTADATTDTYYHMLVKELGYKKEPDEIEDGEDIPEAPTEDEDVEEEDPTGSGNGEAAEPEFDEDGNLIVDPESLEDDQFVIKDDLHRQGVIRRVDKAHLIKKTKNDGGLFDELWVYNTTDNMRDSLNIKKEILSATDIAPNTNSSEDGSQKYSMHTMGDMTYIEIMNLPQ